MLRASVIVPARNAELTLPRTLESLAVQDLEDEYEVIVVDDGSTDGTVEVARRAPGGVRVISQPALGPGDARNLGVAQSEGSALAFCDADVFPIPGWLRAGLRALGRAALVQGRVLPDPSAALGPFDRSLWIEAEDGLWQAANLFATRELFDRVGGFPSGVKPIRGKQLAEDVLFGWHARRLSVSVGFCAQALAHHAVFPRTWRAYVAERSRLRHFPEIAREAPELRRTFFYRHVFLNRRSAWLDLAVVAAGAAACRRTRLPLIAVIPYLRTLRRHSMRARPRGPRATLVAGADALADLVGIGALLAGSVGARSVVL